MIATSVTSFIDIFIMPSCAIIGFFSRSGKNPYLSFHQMPLCKRKEIRQEKLHHIKHGQNEKYFPKDFT